MNITEEAIERVLQHRSIIKIRTMEFGSSWDGICAAGIDTMRNALCCGNIPALKITNSNIYDIATLVSELEHVRNVRGLQCHFNTEDHIPTLCSIMKCMNKLCHLHTNIPHDSSTCQDHLADSIRASKCLHSVSLLHHRSLHTSILEALKCCNNHQSLCHIGSDGVSLLFDDHKSWINLHTLNLYDNRMGSEGAETLSKVLVHCKSLQHLNLRRNRLGDRGAVALAERTEEPHQITTTRSE